MYNNESTESKISRKRNRSDSEKNDSGFDQSAKISTSGEIFLEKPKLEKNQSIKFCSGEIQIESGSDKNKSIKNSLSLTLPDEINYDLINYSSYNTISINNKDKCSCNFFKELFVNFGKYIKTPVFFCSHRET